ncbi:MAG TPA: M23 family metallopeptidase [Ktedonobacteraceae bacterium]|nr:M23 family metallopeptidase [Ktedonobacteraceae bacterium]
MMFSSPEPPGSQSRILHTDTRMPVYIPAASKRRTDPLPEVAPHKRRFALMGIGIGSILVILLASSFVVPLDSSQHPLTIAQVIGHIFSNASDSGVNTPLHAPSQSQINGPRSDNNGTSCRGTDIWSTCATYVTASGLQGTGQMQHPIQGAVISQYFGNPEYQLWCGCWRPHTGIDLAAPYGTPIMAADTGQVIWVGWDWSGLGWAVKINHGNYIATIYGHMDHYIVKVGQDVMKGQIIGYEGSTGASTGPHVHFMVLVHNVWVNPLLYVALP